MLCGVVGLTGLCVSLVPSLVVLHVPGLCSRAELEPPPLAARIAQSANYPTPLRRGNSIRGRMHWQYDWSSDRKTQVRQSAAETTVHAPHLCPRTSAYGVGRQSTLTAEEISAVLYL